MSNRHFLLVDDEAYLTTLVAQALKKRGDTVEVARDGNLAIAAVRQRRPDLIITDYQMPNCDGLTMATRLRQSPETMHIPLIMLSGRGHRITPAEQAQTNIQRILEKPFSMRELMTVLDEVLATHAAAA
ncbi:MAG TPA: response regulator [Tepidisphaeraceae bacterium]|jgi:DNA-binding response OmpR family regulator|nr:response regulator [Tepidisphaeraceae bacterium]